MKPALLLCAILLSACAKRPPQVATTPPPAPVKPAPLPPPEPKPREPLSIPQTDVRLPAPQPISPEALATIPQPPPPEPAEAPLPKPARKAGPPLPPPAVAPKPEPEAVPAAPEPPIRTLLSPAERRQLTRAIAIRRRQTEAILSRVRAASPTPAQNVAIGRVVSFLELAAKAEEQGDLREADALSVRALSLARELVDGR